MSRGAAVFSLYAAIVAFMTYPAITLTSRTYAQRGDSMGMIWWLWWTRYASARGLAVNPVSMVAVPFGRNMNVLSRDPLSVLTLKLLTRLTGETVAYNVFLIGSYLFAAVCMFVLAKYLTKSRGAAAVAGIAFGICPYMLLQGKEHIGLLTVGWIPLFFYFLIRWWREKGLVPALCCVGAFTLTALFNFHYGLICGVMAVAFLLVMWLTGKPWSKLRAAGNLVAVGLIAAGIIGLAVFYFARRGSAGGLQALYLYSARPWDYILPHADAAAFGWISRGYILSHLHGGFLSESSLFLGYVPLGLAAFGTYTLARNRRIRCPEGGSGCVDDGGDGPARERAGWSGDFRVACSLGFTAAVCFLFSMPPTFGVLGLKLYMPSYLLHFVVPEVRAYARFGIGVMFCVAVVASYGAAALLRKSGGKRARLFVVAVTCLVIVVEYSIVPPFYSLDTGSVKDYYRWLRNAKEGSIAAVYPFFYADDFGNYRYLLDQRHHRKPLVNNGEPESEADNIRQTALSLYEESTPGILKRLGVKYVLAIPSLYLEGNHVNYVDPVSFEDSRVPDGFRKVSEFEDCVIYEVVAEPARVYPLFMTGSSQAVVSADGKAWHPGMEEMVVDIRSELQTSVVADVTIEASATEKEGTIEFVAGGAATGRNILPVWRTEFKISSVKLNPGSNLMTIRSKSEPSPVPEIPGATEVQAGVLIGDLDIELVR